MRNKKKANDHSRKGACAKTVLRYKMTMFQVVKHSDSSHKQTNKIDILSLKRESWCLGQGDKFVWLCSDMFKSHSPYLLYRVSFCMCFTSFTLLMRVPESGVEMSQNIGK